MVMVIRRAPALSAKSGEPMASPMIVGGG